MRKAYTPKPRYTQEQYQKAASVDLLKFLEERGYEFKQTGSSFKAKGVKGGFIVNKNLWNWFARGIGGTAIDYLAKVENMDYVEAVFYLCGEQYNADRKPIEKRNEEPPKPKEIVKPMENSHARHTFAYLSKTRRIDNEIISDLMHQKKIYESLEYFAKVSVNGVSTTAKLMTFDDFAKLQEYKLIDSYKEKDGLKLGFNSKNELKYIGIEAINYNSFAPHKQSGFFESVSYVNNCVFCGYDEEGEMKYAAMRSVKQDSSFRQDAVGSDKQYGFTMEGTSDELYVFEAPIDAMSHATLFKLEGLDWKQDSRISMGGLSDLALEQYLKTHPDIKKIHFCLDNDEAGKNKIYGVYDEEKGEQTIKSLKDKYEKKGYEIYVDLPVSKDYNNDLKLYLDEQSEEDEDELSE